MRLTPLHYPRLSFPSDPALFRREACRTSYGYRIYNTDCDRFTVMAMEGGGWQLDANSYSWYGWLHSSGLIGDFPTRRAALETLRTALESEGLMDVCFLD